MSTNPAKDFGPIADDYAFFENHATEAQEDAKAYVSQIEEFVPSEGAIRMLDFGCGSGTFTARFLNQAGWPPARVRLALVEPVESARLQAVARLAGFTESPIMESATLPEGLRASFDFILVNHVLYYVPDLVGRMAELDDALSAAGVLAIAIAGRTNALIEFWILGFGLLGREIPYHTSENVEAALHDIGAAFQKQQVAYDLTFPDTEANRMRIIRFLLADHLADLPHRPLLELFDRYTHAGQIHIQTASDHFTIRSGRSDQ
jgi:trans-aconitate 2-methyltransferase